MQTVDLIKSIVDKIETDVNIETKTDVNNTIVITTCDTRWITTGSVQEIEGKDFYVVSFQLNKEVVLKPLIDNENFTTNTFNLKKPSFLHATPKMAKNEFNSEYDKEEYLPLIYLYEVIRDRKNNDEESMIDRESELRLFFLQQANSKDWLTDDHYSNVIKPMGQMVDEFEKQIKQSKFFTDSFDSERFNLVNISLLNDQSKSLFDCNLSGVELKLFSEIRKNLSCESKLCN